MFQTIKNLWRRDEQPESWKVAAASAMKMEMGVESLETRIMLAGSAVVDDVVDHIQPEFAPQIASEVIAEATVQATEVEFAPETISLRNADTTPAEAGASNDGNDQSLVLNLNETSVLSVSLEAADPIESTDSIVDEVASVDVQDDVLIDNTRLEFELDSDDAELVLNDADDASSDVSNVGDSTVRTSRSAPLTAPEQGANRVALDLKFDVESDAVAYDFEFLEGHETRGPPAATGDSTNTTSDLTLYAPLSSNASDNATYGDHNCPDLDGSQSVCGDTTLILGSDDTLGGNQNLGQSVLNNGLVSPGNSPGILNITGSFDQSSDGTLLIEIYGLMPGVDGYDQVNVDGDVTLDGLLQVMLDDSFVSSLGLGDEIEFLTYTGTLTGDFANVSGLGIPGTSLFLMPIHDVANKRYILRVESVFAALTDEIRSGIGLAGEALEDLGSQFQSVLDSFNEPLPIINQSIFDLLGSSASQSFADFFDFADAIDTFETTAGSTLGDLQSLIETRINSLLSAVSGSPVGSIAAYVVSIGGRDELHVEFIIDWSEVVTLSGLNLTDSIPADVLSQLGLSVNGTSDLDVAFDFAARFGIVVDVTTPTSIDSSDVSVELSQLELSANVSEPVTGITLELGALGSSIGISGGQFDLSSNLAVTLNDFNNANRISVADLDTLFTNGFAASVASEWTGSLFVELPLVISLGAGLEAFGQPIVRIENELLVNEDGFQSETSASVDLEIAGIQTELLDLLDEIHSHRPQFEDLPFPIPASFGVSGLFDSIGDILDMRSDAEDYFAMAGADATISGLVEHLIDTRDLTVSGDLFGITFDLTGGYDSGNGELFLNVQANFSGTETYTDIALRDLADAIVTVIDGLKNNDTFRRISGTTDVGTFVYNEAASQWQLISVGAAFPSVPTPNPNNIPPPQNGDLFRLTSPVEQAGVYRYNGSTWVAVSVASGEDFPEMPSDGDLFTVLASEATGFTINETSLAIHDMDGNPTANNVLIESIEVGYHSMLDVTVGLSLSDVLNGTGTLGSDIAFLRVNTLEAGASLDMTGISLSLSIDGPGGSDAAVLIENAEIFLSGGVSLVEFSDGFDFVTTGEVSALLPLSFDVQVGAPINTAEFGTPTILIDDSNIFDEELPNIRVDFVIGPTVRDAILDIAAEWDALIGGLLGDSGLNSSLPLIGQSVIELLGGSDGSDIVNALSIESELTTYLSTPDPTVSGLVDVLTTALNTRLGSLLAVLPLDISGGLKWDDIDEAIFTLNLGINIEQDFELNVDAVALASETGPTADILSALSDLGVSLTGNFDLAVEAALLGSIALTIDATDLANGSGSLTNENISIELLEPLTANLDISVTDLNLGVDFSAAIPGLAPGIQEGTIGLTALATFGLTGTALENVIRLDEITDGPLANHLVITTAGSFDARLPIVGIVEAIPNVDGSLVVSIEKDDLFDLTTAPLTVIDAELTISEFIFLRGTIAGTLATQRDITLVGGATQQMDLLTIGIGNADLFIGIGGPSHIDLDGNGQIDADEMNADAVGLAVNDANVAIAIFAPTDTSNSNRYLAVGATADTVSPLGLPLDFSMTLTDVAVSFNFGTDNAVDFLATDFGNGVGNGLMVETGADPFVLDMDSEILQAEANVTLNLGGFVLVTGIFAFSVEEGEVVTDDTGVAKAVDILTIGASNVDVQIGSFDQDGTTLVAGLELTDIAFGIAILSTTDPSDSGVYYSAKAFAASVTPIGLPSEISITATNVLLAINTGNNGAVDFTHANTTYNGEVNVGGGNTVDLDFATELYQASATLSIALASYVFIDGTFAFSRGPVQNVRLTDDTEKEVSGFTIGGSNASIFIGIGGPYPANASARGFSLTGVEFGLAIFTELTAGGSTYYALEATVDMAAMVNLTDIDLTSDLVSIAINGTTDASGEVIDFANSGFDGSDEDTAPDGFLEVFTGGEQPVEIDLSEALIRIEILAGTITITEGGSMHSMSGNFAFELSNDDLGQPQFVAGIANLVFNGTKEIEDGVGALVIKDTGVALLVYGRESASGGGLAVDAGLGLRVNTTGGPVNETITVGGQDITINSAGDEVVFFIVNATFTIGDFIYINGSLKFGEAVTLTNGTATLDSGIVDIFFGSGPYLLSNGEVNPDAVGILITDALVAIVSVNGEPGLALWAQGDVQLIGVPGVQASGTVTIEVNTTGVVIEDDLTITDGLGASLGIAEFDFATTDDIERATGDVTIGVPDVFEIDGEFTFTMLPNGILEVDIAYMTLRVFPTSATEEDFSITAHATFTIDRNDGFKLRFIQVVNFSIYDVDAGNSTSGTPPPELEETLGFPVLTVGAGGNPLAAVINPLNGNTVDVTTLNAQGFIDITFSVGTTDILDSGAEFTLSGNGVTADLRIDNNNVEHLYGNTYRYYLTDADPTNETPIFAVPDGSTDATVTVNFIAGSFTNSITGALSLADSTNTFTIEDALQPSGATFNIGPLQIIGPRLQLSDFAYTDGTLFITIGLGAAQANFNFGDGQDDSGVTASLTDVLFTFDVELGFDVLNPNFFSDPLSHVSGPGLTGAFTFSSRLLQVIVPDVFQLDAQGVFIAYDPAATGSQDLLTVNEAVLTLIPFNITGTVENLVIRNDGFAFDDLEIEWNADPGMPLRMAGLFEANSLGLGITDFDITFGEAFVFTGSVTIFTDSAVFLPGQAVEATVSQAPGSDEHGLSATLNFGDDGSIESLQFHIDQLEIQIGSILTIVAGDVDIDSGAWGDANQELVSFGLVGAQLRLGSVIIGGEARNFAFMGDGSFAALGNFAVILSAEAVDGAGIGWPSWMPIRVTEIGLLWPDITNEPTDFILIVSAEVVGLHNLPLNFTGAIDRIQIDIDKLVSGEFPIVGVEGIAVGVEGDLFGGEITAQLLGGILRLDADGNVIDSLDVTTPVADSILFAGLEGGFAFAGVGGFTIRLGLSELGPLGVFINGQVPGGILLEPNSGLAINDFSAGVEIFTSLPDYTSPFELEGASFGLPTDLTPLMWLDQIRDQVAAQYLALLADPNMPTLVDAFSETMTITGGAKLFSIYTSQETFNGEVIIKFSTDGKFALTGKLNFAADNLSVSARLYADLSDVGNGNFRMLFLATAPDQAPIMTIYGLLELNVTVDSVVLDLEGGVIYEAPLGVIGDVTGTDIQDVELFRIDGSVMMTLDLDNDRFTLDVSGTMTMVYIGTIGSVSGRLVMESSDSSDPLALPQIWGVLKIESGLDKLAEAGIELNAEALLEINTSNVERIETLRLIGIVGDQLATVNGGAALTALDALSPVIPPLPLELLPASVKLLIESSLGVTLDENATVEVIVTGAKWKVRDDENDVTYFLEEVAGGQLKISSEFQTFELAPETYMLTIRGDLIFRFPAFEADGITPGPDLLVISGGASIKINRDGLEAFILGRAKIGPTGSELLEFDAQGILIINDEGIAAGLSLQLDVDNIPGIDFTGGFTLILNTMSSGLQQVAVPVLFQDVLLPTPPTINGEAPGDLIADDGDNTTLFWEVNADGVSLTPVLIVPGEAPNIDGSFDPNTAGTNTPFLVIAGNATLVINPLNVELLRLEGQFSITIEPSRLNVTAAFSTSNIVLGTLTGTAALTLDGDGLYGVAQVTRDIGSPLIPGVELNLDFLIEFNTSAISKQIQRFEVDRTTGMISNDTVTAELEAFQVRIVAGGELRVQAADLVLLTGRFEFVISADELAISIAARLAIGGPTPIDAAVEGAALLRADGFAFQILAAVSAGTTETSGGAGFILELGGSALVRINTINESIDEIAGITVNLAAASGTTPYFEIRLEGAGRLEFFIDGIGGFKIEGEIRLLANNDGFAVNVDGEFTANLGGTTLLRMSASGSFQIFTSATSLQDIGPSDGIAGKITLSLGATSLLGGVGFDIDGTFTLEVNTTGTFISHVDGTLVNLQAGPYARVMLVGHIRFSLGGAASFGLDGNFAFEMNATRIAVTANASLQAVVGGTTLLDLAVNDGLLAIGLDGIVANIDLGTGLSGPGYEFNASFQFKLNTTGENVFINNGVVLPGIKVAVNGDLILPGGFKLEGQFAIELNTNGLVIDANAELVLGTFLKLDLTDSFLQISDRGIAAQLSVGGRLGGTGFEFRAGTSITLRLNTTGQAVTRVNGRNVNLRAGYFAELELIGDLSLMNILTLRGRFVATASLDALDISIDASLSVMDIGFRVNAAARISTGGIAFRSQISLGTGGSTITPINGLSITGTFELQVNTFTSSQLGLAPSSIRVGVSGGINVLGFTLININFGIGVRADGFDANFAGRIDLGVFAVNVSGSFDSTGHFSVTGSAGIYVTAGPAYLNATARLTIDSTSGFSVRVDGGAGLRIAGINIGVSIAGEASISGTNIRLHARGCVRINLLFTSFSICAGVTFNIGTVPASNPGNANTTPPPSIGSVSGGNLTLDLNRLGGANNSNRISILDEDNGNIRVNGNGFSQVFSGVNNINLNLGAGDDYLFVDTGVAANVNINGGDGDDEIIYLGSGRATLNGGNGNDELRVISNRNFRPEPNETGQREAIGATTFHALIGGAGDDILIGGSGNDLIQGGAGNDRLDGGGGDDTISGGDNDDIIYGGEGNDMLMGDNGDDVIYGEQGNDTLDGGFGNDILLGGSGSEVIFWTAGTGDDIEINGQSGDDQIVFIGNDADNTITASQGDMGAFVLEIDGQSVIVNEFESARMEGRAGSDSITVNDLSATTVSVLELQLGNDNVIDHVAVNGLATDDEYTFFVEGSTAVIQPTGGTRINITQAGTEFGGANAVLTAGFGNDIVNIRQTVAGIALTVHLDEGDDEVVFGDAITGIAQVAGPVTIFGGLNNDQFAINAASNTTGINATLNATTLETAVIPSGRVTFFDIETMNLDFGSGDDTLTINQNLQTTVVDLADGNDTVLVRASEGDLDILGGAGNDTVWVGTNGSSGNGTLAGTTGQLTFDGQDGSDSLNVDNSGDTNANTFTIQSSNLLLGEYGSIPYVNFESLTVNSGIAGDTITVESTHGHPTTINSNAGADTIHVQTIAGATNINTSSENDTINIGSVVNGSGTLNGILALLTIQSGAGTDTLNVDDSADTSDNAGEITATTITGFNMTVGIVYGEFEFANFVLGSGNDTLTVTSTSTATYDIDAASGNDTVRIESIDGTTTITGNDGDDDFVVGTSGLLDPVNELLTIHGAAGNNTLTVTDNADTTNNSGQLTATTLRGLGMADGIDYFDIAVLDITLGMANDEFTIFTSHVGQTTLNGNNGNDTIWIETLAGRTFVNGDAGDDLVTVGLLVDGDTLPTINHLRQQLTVTGGSGSDTLTLDDRGNNLDLVIGIDQSQVTGLTDQPVEYFGLAYLNIFAGSGSEVLNVRGTTATEETNVLLADGDERIFVSSDANLTQANKNEIDFLTGHLNLLVGGNLNINAGDGRHKLMVSDEAATAGDNNVVITDSDAAAIATGMEIFMSGLAVSNISYGAAATGNFADGITIWSGHGNDTFNVDATHYRDATDNGGHQIRTITSLNTGLGDDTITVSLIEASDGFFVLNTQGPYNDQPNASDADTVDASGSTLDLIIFGGQDADNITGGQGRDIIFGDRGSVLFFATPPADTSDWTAATGLAVIVLGNGGPGDRTDGRVHEPAFVRSVDVTVGGNDIISGQAGDDYIMGQFGDDQIDGDAGEDDIIGGHNVAFGPDGNDTISGGDDADVIIGDNGTITRNWIEATNEFERHPAPFADVIRTVVLYDNLDGIGGDDIINGDGGDDILFGQLGNDTLDGGAGDDELTGGLGNNALIGGAENDVLVGGPAQILRAYNEDGTPLIDSNGSWHRDIVFELVGTVIGFVDINDTPIEYLMWSLAEELLRADIILVVGVYDADGNRVFDEKREEWKTRLLLIDLDAPGNDVIDGMGGDDIIIGGFGDDTLSGGDGNDLIIGDYGTNLLPYGTDLPLMVTGIRLRDDLTGTLDLDPLGTLVIPDFAVETVMTQTTVPFMQFIPPHATNLQDIAYNDLIAATDGTVLDAFASIVPDIRNHLDSQPGNDTLDGGAGDDTIIGDNLVIRSPIDTIHVAYSTLMNSIVTRLVQIQTGLYHVSSMFDLINTEIVGNPANNTFTAASDIITGGDGNDTIAGDNALWIGPAAYQWPIGDDILADGTALYRRMLDIDWALSDANHAIVWAKQRAHREIRRARLLVPRAEFDRNTLSIRNDIISGGAGDDTISGDDSIVDMPVVTSFVNFRDRTREIRDLERERETRRVLTDLSQEITRQLASHVANYALHIARDYRRLTVPARVDRDAGKVSYNLIKGNDTINAGADNDMVAGDTLIVGKPAFNVTPVNRQEVNRLRGPMRRMLNRTRTRGFFHKGTANYQLRLRIPARRGPTLSQASDQIFGEDGNDILIGDNAEMSLFVSRDGSFDPTRQEVRSVPKMGNIYGDSHRGGDDTIDGGAGDDILDGRAGFDTLDGGIGADTIYGGAQRDTITSDDDDLRASQGGAARRNTFTNFSNPWMDRVTSVIANSWGDMAPTPSGLWIRMRLRR